MKFEIDFSPIPDYILLKTEGEASFEGFENLFKTLVSSPQWKPGTGYLVDHRKLILKELSSKEMSGIVSLVRKYSKEYGAGPCAFVVADSLGFGLARMYELLGGEGLHPKIGVFYAMDEAIEWLKTPTNFSKET